MLQRLKSCFFLMLLVLIALPTLAVETPEIAQYPIHVVPQGKFISQPQPDGTDVLTCTDGIYIFQDQKDQNRLIEFRARRAVVFYAQKNLQDPSEQPDALGIYLEDDVIMQVTAGDARSENKFTAERMYFDFQSNSALVIDARLKMQFDSDYPALCARAREIKIESMSTFTLKDVKLTTDEFYKPHTYIGAQEATVFATPQGQSGSQATDKSPVYDYEIKNIVLNFEGIPVFFWPKAAAQVGIGQASTPIKSVHFSSSSAFGSSVETEWDSNWLLGLNKLEKELDTTLRLDGFTKRGPASGFEADYKTDDFFGNLKTYAVHDNGLDRLGQQTSRKDVKPLQDWRGRATWQHRQYLPQSWQVTFETSYLSDPDFLESWSEKEFDTGKEQETLVYLKQQRDNWAFDFLAKWQLNDFDYTVTELPRAGLHLAGQDIFEILTYYHDGYISRQAEAYGDRDVPDPSGSYQPSILNGNVDEGQYAAGVSRHELALPLKIENLRVVPTVIGTYAYNDVLPHTHTFQGALGGRISTQLWHLNDNFYSRFWDIDRVRHIVVPQFSAFWVDCDSEDISQNGLYNISISQRWQTKRGPQNKQHNVDFLRFDSSLTLVEHDIDNAALPSDFYFNTPEWQLDRRPLVNTDLSNFDLARREEINRTYSDHVKASWVWLISDSTAFIGSNNTNIHDGVFSQSDLAIAVQRSPRLSYYFGSRFLNNGDPYDQADSNFLTAGGSYRVNTKYTVGAAHEFDLERGSAAYTQAVIIRSFPQWYGAFSFSYDANRDSASFSFSIWPKSLQNLTLGSRRFNRITP